MKKELQTLFITTPQKNYELYKDPYMMFVIEKLPLGNFSVLTSIDEDIATSDFVDHLYIHYSDFVKRSYVDHHEFCVVLKRSTTKEQFTTLMNEVITYFKEHDIHNVCAHCHKHKLISYVHNGETMDLVCDDCLETLPQTDYSSHPLGILSALLLCLIPGIIWPLFHDFGYYVCLDGLLFGFCAFRGFLLLGENMDRKGLMLSFVSILPVLLIAQLFTFALEIQQVFKTNFKVSITLSQAFAALPDFWGTDLLLVALSYLGIALIGALFILFVMYRKYKKKHSHRNIFEKMIIDYGK